MAGDLFGVCRVGEERIDWRGAFGGIAGVAEEGNIFSEIGGSFTHAEERF